MGTYGPPMEPPVAALCEECDERADDCACAMQALSQFIDSQEAYWRER
jgi:hypothetical protein